MSASPIVWIDHDLDYLLLARRALRGQGISNAVVCLTDGGLGSAYLAQFPQPQAEEFPALIVIEVREPLLEGLGLLKWIRARSQFNNVPVLLGLASPGVDRENAIRLGASGFFIKVRNLDAITELAAAIVRDWL
jgi:CheY-like chemotaxis protein